MRQTRRVWSPDSCRAYTQAVIERSACQHRRTLRSFAEWLSSSWGLKASTITDRVRQAGRFIEGITDRLGGSCASAFRSVTIEIIEDYFVEYGKTRGMPARRNMQSAMRLFLRYARERGWVGQEMVGAVPSLSSYRLSDVPRCVTNEQLSILFASPFKGGRCARRDWAIVHLLAAYGVRRGQLSALKLQDIDWHGRTITFKAHKCGKSVRHSLTSAVAEALADYLRDERPGSETDYVFLRSTQPYERLSPSAITAGVELRMERCGLPRLSPHTFRHAFARRLLDRKQPVKTIADLLGHRSLAAVDIYAKVDYARLLEVAGEWPETVS